ncbi:MAG: TonB-dependent receptor [Bacteroides sp.]|nr:TonB-dependent receptor [Bacteroides sp.]
MKKLFLLLAAIMTLSLCGYAQNMTVHGVVIDENDDPLPGATVMPMGGGTGTATNVDGEFTLSLPGNVKDLQVSFVGYATQKVKVTPNMTIRLVNNNNLKEVVVTGYGSAKKLGSIVGAVSVVGEDALENIPTATFVDALQGQVSGLSIYSSSGDPSSTDNQIRLRGVNSINAGTTPLFILDGAPVSESVFTTLNPSDIENITVLKDAASVAIYGSRAANGVIVISSKKGKFGEKAKVTVRANMGWSQLARDGVEMMNSEQYIQFRDKVGLPVSDDMRNAWEVYGINTDWLKETYSSSSPTYSIDGTVQGGGENLSYYVSLNHYANEGIVAQSSMRRESLRFNLNARVNDWFRVGLQTNLGYTKYETNNESNAVYSGSGIYVTNPMVFARKALPMDSPYYWTVKDGQAHFGDRAEWLHFSGIPTPESNEAGRSVWRNKLTINATLSEQLNPVKGLTIRAQQNVDAYDQRISNYGFVREPYYTPMGDYVDYQGNTEGYNQQSFGRYYAFTYTNTAEYNISFGNNSEHTITALLGEESIIAKSESFGLFASGIQDNRTLLLPNATSITPSDLSQSIASQTFNSIFLNASYNYDSRYFIEATYRRDGSSKFAPGHRWANFWSVGAMWNLKSEKFLVPYTWLDNLQAHLSYGTTGNSSIGNYMYFGYVAPFGTPYQGNSGIGISNPQNPTLSWETVNSLDFGVNFGFLNIFTGEVDYYWKKTTDMLLAVPWSYTTGFGSAWGNIGDMVNTGIDFDIRADIIKTKDWYWAVRGNFNYNHNEITHLYNDQDELTMAGANMQYKVGHDAGALYSVRYAGVDPRDGQQQWIDCDGNLTKEYNQERDAVLLGKSLYAPWGGGFGTDLRWKGISLKADFTWAAKKYMLNNDLYFCQNSNFATDFNQTTKMLDVWTEPGQVTDIPAYGQALQFDDRWVENASFVRLKNLTIQYSFPAALLSKLYLQSLNVHFTGRNLLTFTGYTGYDPEPETNIVAFYYPNTRQYEIGLDVTF